MQMLATGTLVEVDDPSKSRPYFIGEIAGTGARRNLDAGFADDEFTTMYEIHRRYLNGSEWQFTRFTVWQLPEHVTEISPDEAPTAAGLCHDCGVPILLIDGNWDHYGSPDDVRQEHRDHAEQRRAVLHRVIPSPRTVELANVWDIDAATDRQYPVTDIPLSA